MPTELFLNNVLPYVCATETRDEWREFFYSSFKDLVKDCKSTGEAA